MQAGMKAREQALCAALDDMENWLATGMLASYNGGHCGTMRIQLGALLASIVLVS